jgi:hypothetical protein
MTMIREATVCAEQERRQWFVALALGLDEPDAAPPAPPVPADGDVLP